MALTPLSDRARALGRRGALTAGLAAAAASPWWGRAVLAELAFFRVRKVEIAGVHYVAPSDLLARLRVDTTRSVWDDPEPLERRLAGHPQVRDVSVGRRLPGTLVVHVVENLPLALVSTPRGFVAYDERGRELPLDPSRVAVDLPIIARRDTAVLGLLARLRAERPALFARVSEVRRVGKAEVLLHFATVPVRAMVDVTPERLAEIFPVEADLAKRRARVAELDLRFRDQVIARLQ